MFSYLNSLLMFILITVYEFMKIFQIFWEIFHTATDWAFKSVFFILSDKNWWQNRDNNNDPCKKEEVERCLSKLIKMILRNSKSQVRHIK